VSVVIISNRVARSSATDPIQGGLAAALLPAIRAYGAVWVGSSGKLADRSDKEPFAEVEALGKGALATVDLPRAHYSGYYEGFSNSALWPMLHSRADLIRATRDHYESYREVNAFMARAALRFTRSDSIFWVHDYHFLMLGAELRRHGIRQPIGFFLHTPWPGHAVVTTLPHHQDIVRAMLAYNLIGFQTEDDLANFAGYLKDELGLHIVGDTVTTERGTCQLATFPIGIDADAFAKQADQAETGPKTVSLQASLRGASLVIGVDRVDYSKGLMTRIRAFDRLLSNEPALKRSVTMLQIASPSRDQIDVYKSLQSELATLIGSVNGKHGEVDWTPIRYLNKSFPQAVLPGLYRASKIGLVTPFHDGMNLVAKEYVAAQNPTDPGVLVLSRFAGAARELDAALLVNPHDVDDIASKLAAALRMGRDERSERWIAMMKRIRASSIHSWFSRFIATLQTMPSETAVHQRALPRPFDHSVSSRQ
jgi:trehalose 6-phosphate synthase